MNKKRQRQEIGGENGFEHWGGYMAAKKAKLQGQFLNQAAKEASEGNQGIFRGVAIFVNGYTVPSADELKRIMMLHGGVYQHYYSTEHTTHVIATNLPDVKIKQLKSLHVRIVKPDWIVACLEAGRQVDYRPYLLYSHQSATQPSIHFGVGSKSINPAVSTSVPVGGHPASGDIAAIDNEKKCDAITDKDAVDSKSSNVSNSTKETYVSPPHSVEGRTSKSIPLPQNVSKERVTSRTSKDVSPQKDDGLKNTSTTSARCATEPNFLSEFYNNSRLHHISTMGAMFKQYVSDLRMKSSEDFPGLERLKKWKMEQPNSVDHQVKYTMDEEDMTFTLEPHELPANKSSSSQNRIIMHIDMDCFFVSVGLRDFPDLKGQPVAVTHSKGGSAVPNPSREGADRKFELNYYKQRLESKLKSKIGGISKDCTISAGGLNSRIDGIDDTDSMAEIASCSYEARRAGLKNGMFMGTALKLCPNLKTIPYNFEGYKEVAYLLYDTVASYTLDIEAVSCDEMFVDCTNLLKESNTTPQEFAAFLRAEIKEKTQCSASTGFGGNRLLARLATRKAKPDGQFYLEPSDVHVFMKTVKIEDLPGVGRSMAYRLQAIGVHTCDDLQSLSLSKLREFGNKTGEALYDHCRGRDSRPLNFAHQRKSVSAEVNYGIRFKNHTEAEKFLRQLSGEVEARLSDVNMKGRCITLKLMVRAENAPSETAKYMGHGVCDNIAKSSTLQTATSDARSIAREVLSIMKKLAVNPCDLRGIGIQVSRLENTAQANAISAGALDKFFLKKQSYSSASNTDNVNKTEKVPTHVSAPATSSADPQNTTNVLGRSVVNPPPDPKRKLKAVKSPIKRTLVHAKGLQGIDQFMVSRKRTTRRDNPAKLPSPAELDLDVLDALPEDIRNEILEEYASKESSSSSHLQEDEINKDPAKAVPEIRKGLEQVHAPPAGDLDVSLSQVDPAFLHALPSELREELEADYQRKKLAKKQNIVHESDHVVPFPSTCEILNIGLSCVRDKSVLSSLIKPSELRTLIRLWVTKESEPLPLDVHILKHYLHDLVTDRLIDELNLIVKCFHRCVLQRGSTVWADSYHDIISSMQSTMMHVYQARLHVEDFAAVPSCSSSKSL